MRALEDGLAAIVRAGHRARWVIWGRAGLVVALVALKLPRGIG